MIVNYKVLDGGYPIKIDPQGEWFDLFVRGDNKTEYFIHDNIIKLPLGIILEMPAGIEANIAARSSTSTVKGVFNPNGIGIIDTSHCGEEDEIKFPCRSVDSTPRILHGGDKICQVKFVLSQKATLFQRLNYLLTGIKIKQVTTLKSSVSRGGFGHTGN